MQRKKKPKRDTIENINAVYQDKEMVLNAFRIEKFS